MSELGMSSIATGQQITETDKGIQNDPTQATPEAVQPTIEEADIREYVLACKKESEEAYKDMRLKWVELWDAYQAYVDYSKKESWQAQVVIPEIPAIVKKATSLICRILLKTDNYFDLDPGLIKDEQLPGAIEDPFLAGQKLALKYWLDKADNEQLLREWIECSFVYGIGYLKWFWMPKEQTRVSGKQEQNVEVTTNPMGMPMIQRKVDTYFERETYQSSCLVGKVIPPESIYTDPDHTFYIEETMTTLDEVIRLADGGLFSQEAVEKLKSQDYADSSEENDRLKRLNLSSHTNAFRKKVKLQTYWGNVLDREGAVSIKNAQVIIANELHLLNPDNLQNPFWHKMPPYVELAPIRTLFRKEGKGLAESSLSIQKAINDMTNMSLDGMIFKLIKMFEVDPDRLRVPEQLKTLRPGQPILTKGGPGRVVNEVQVSDIPQGTLAELEILRRAIQNDTGVNDFLLGGQQNKVNTTATEASIRSAEGNALFEGISRVIEGGIEKSIMMVQSLILQYWDDFSDPALQELAQRYGLPFSEQSREAKILFIQPNMKVKVKGISGYFQKAEDLKKYIDFLQVAGGLPPIAMRLNLRELLDRIVRAFDFTDPDKLVISPQMEQMMQQAEQMRLMMTLAPPPPPGMQQPGGPPSGPGGPSGPPPPPPGGPPGPPQGMLPPGMM